MRSTSQGAICAGTSAAQTAQHKESGRVAIALHNTASERESAQYAYTIVAIGANAARWMSDYFCIR